MSNYFVTLAFEPPAFWQARLALLIAALAVLVRLFVLDRQAWKRPGTRHFVYALAVAVVLNLISIWVHTQRIQASKRYQETQPHQDPSVPASVSGRAFSEFLQAQLDAVWPFSPAPFPLRRVFRPQDTPACLALNTLTESLHRERIKPSSCAKAHQKAAGSSP